MLVSLYASQRAERAEPALRRGTRLRSGEGVRELERVPQEVALDWAANAPPEAFVSARAPRAGAPVGSGALYVRAVVQHDVGRLAVR